MGSIEKQVASLFENEMKASDIISDEAIPLVLEELEKEKPSLEKFLEIYKKFPEKVSK